MSARRLWIVTMLAAYGCGSGNRPVPVEGTVHLDGQPLAGAMVTFMPLNAGAREAHGYTTETGSFKLSTFRPDDGAIPGEYKVLVSYTAPAAELPAGSTQDEAMRALEKSAKVKKRQPIVVPESYRNPEKTKLRQSVPPDGVVKLELHSKG